MRSSRRVLLLLAAVALTFTPASAFARPGGGSGGYDGGGGGGGGGYDGGSGGGSGGGGFSGDASDFIWVVVVVVGVVAFQVVNRRKVRGSGSPMNTGSDRDAHRDDPTASSRAEQVEAQVDVLADTDPSFEPDDLEATALGLFNRAQVAWTGDDLDTLKTILAPAIYTKWSEQLSDYRSRGEVNVVKTVGTPKLELVDVENREAEADDTVTFRISAELIDYVTGRDGDKRERTDGSTQPVEYWTLRKNETGWMVAAIEQAAEGRHHLTDEIETDGWNQQAIAREATLDVAAKTSAAHGLAGSGVLGLTNIAWSTDADEAARDLALVDGRFDKPALEVAIQAFLEEWADNDGSLDFTEVRTPNRTVMRDADITGIEVQALVSKAPVVFDVAVAAEGLYYEVARSTEVVLSGDAHQPRALRFVFRIQLDDTPARGWDVIAADEV